MGDASPHCQGCGRVLTCPACGPERDRKQLRAPTEYDKALMRLERVRREIQRKVNAEMEDR